MEEKIKEQLINATDEIFLEWQSKLHIISGDCDPLVSYGFYELIDQLAKQMVFILENQPKLNISKLTMIDGSEINLSDINLGYDIVQKLVDVEQYLKKEG